MSASGVALSGVCGHPEGVCCYPLHVAAQAFAKEREAAFLVPGVIAYVAEHPGCSTRSVYRGVTAGTQEQRCTAIKLAVSQGSIREERVRAKLQRFWVAPPSGPAHPEVLTDPAATSVVAQSGIPT